MACHQINKSTIVCCPNIYKFPHKGKEFFFEWHSFIGPTAVRKGNFEPRATIPTGFWDAVTEFGYLSEEKRKQYMISN